MPRSAASFSRTADRAPGSAAIARARLHGALLRDRTPHDPRARDSAAPPSPPPQPELLDLLLTQLPPSGGGQL